MTTEPDGATCHGAIEIVCLIPGGGVVRWPHGLLDFDADDWYGPRPPRRGQHVAFRLDPAGGRARHVMPEPAPPPDLDAGASAIV